jgi:nucleotidyltransferase substrate binding protein (TIGR01987 family)
MALNTEHFTSSLNILESSLAHLNKTAKNNIEYEIFRNATVKSFELSLETAGKLLRKALKLYSSNPASVDALTFKDVLRQATKHNIINVDAVTRWFAYRDNRNNIAHDYGEAFAEQTLVLLTDFIEDAHQLEQTLHKKLGGKDA